MGAKVQEDKLNWGVYIWMYNGKAIVDDEWNHLCIKSGRGDQRKIEMLKDAAYSILKENGLEPGGVPKFLAGCRVVTDEEYEEQKERLAAGLVPDPLDAGSYLDSRKESKLWTPS